MQPSDSPQYRVITARSSTGELIDVQLLADGRGRMRVATIEPSVPGARSADCVQVSRQNSRAHLDLSDHVLLPPAADPHAHLDKALSWDELNPAVGDLGAAIECWQRGARIFDEDDFYRRAKTAALLMLSRGTTAVRTHVDILSGDDPYRGIRALARVAREVAAAMVIEIAALAPPTTESHVISGALDAGADLVGGAPHIADDPCSEVARLVGLAESRGVGVDLHTDEFLFGDHGTIDTFAKLVAHWPAGRTRTAGHCCRLSTMTREELEHSISLLHLGGVSVVTLPITNLYLQGHGSVGAGPRGIAPIDALLRGGVRVAAGADNIRDPFNPMGRGDALETASLLVTAGHQPPQTALDLVTDSARQVLGLERAGPVLGAVADFLAVRAGNQVEAVANAPDARVVIVDGRVVSRTETTTWNVIT